VLLLQFCIWRLVGPARLQGQPLDQDRLSCFHGDEGMGDALATAEQESRPVLGIVVRIQRFRSTWRTVRSGN
jgi:hypothetical protein